MQIRISGHHIDITDSLRSYIEDKFKKLERHSDHIQSITVILSVDNLSQQAEGKVHLKNTDLFAKAQHEDMYAAIDSLVDKLNRQLISHKEKVIDRKHQR